MQENTVAKAVRITGWCIIVGGIIGAFILGYVFPAVTYSSSGRISESYNWGLTIGIIVGSIIGGVFFQGVAEIIRLLQLNVEKMADLIQTAGGETSGTSHKSSVLRDIESNLPKM